MKTSRLSAAAAAGILILSSVACTRQADDTTADTTTSFSVLERQQSFVLEGSAKDYDKDSDLIYSCEAKILMPETLNGADADTLRNAIFKTAFDTVCVGSREQMIEDVFRKSAAGTGYTPVDTVMPADVYDGCLIVDGEVATFSPTILAYFLTISSYEPYAAHGMYGTLYINYDLKAHRIFNLSDILTPEGYTKLPGILRGIARSMRGFTGPTDLTELPADGNFYIDLSNNLVFVYQPYEIASYAQGIIEIPVQAYTISDYITPYGKTLLNL